MCTSYYLEDSNALKGIAYAAAHHRLLNRIRPKVARPLMTMGEVKPGDLAPVIAPDRRRGEGHVFPMIWGFTGKHSLITELQVDVLDRTRNPILLEAWERHRCIIPSSWYFEWERLHPVISYDSFGDQTEEGERRSMYMRSSPVPDPPDGSEPLGDRFMVQARGSSVTLLAGLYRIEELDGVKVPHFLILTQEAYGDILSIHNRMPVMLDSTDGELIQRWLDPGAMPPWETDRLLDKAFTDVVFEKSPPNKK